MDIGYIKMTIFSLSSRLTVLLSYSELQNVLIGHNAGFYRLGIEKDEFYLDFKNKKLNLLFKNINANCSKKEINEFKRMFSARIEILGWDEKCPNNCQNKDINCQNCDELSEYK